jgi:phage tail-like protein
MATVLNNRSSILTDPIRNFRFLVTFIPQNVDVNVASGSGSATPAGETWATNLSKISFGFTSFSGLAATVDSIPYREGGYNTTVHQLPGQTSFAPISLQRGVVLGSSQNWDWMRQLFLTVQGKTTRTVADNFRCDLEIEVLSHPAASINNTAGADSGLGTSGDHVAMRFKVYNAWITNIAYSDLNAGDNAIFVEQMTLVHEGFDVNWAKDLTKSAPAFVD